MAEYRRRVHAVYDIKYDVIGITKYRYKILRGRIAERARDLIRRPEQGSGDRARIGVAGSYPHAAVGAASSGAG
jgi:putative transposase